MIRARLSLARVALTFMSAMSSCGFPEPPTRATLADARKLLDEQRAAVSDITAQIHEAEDELARIVRAKRDAIQDLEKHLEDMEGQVSRTLAYLSHIRRLPHELLGYIFMYNFDDYPCCAWVLASVCSLWRRQVLSMPKLWSKVSPNFRHLLYLLEWVCLPDLSPVPWRTVLRAAATPAPDVLSIASTY